MVIVCYSLIFKFIVFDVNNLLQVKDVIDPLNDVPHKLLLVLNLNGSIGHEEWIGNGDLNSLDVLRLLLICVLVAIRDLHICLLDWRVP